MKVNLKDIEQLITLLSESDLTEIELTDANNSIRLSRQHNNTIAHTSPAVASVPTPPVLTPIPQQATTETAREHHHVKSPIVGTFYGAPAPGKPNFVRVGDEVNIGQILCIIEAMKIMNTIESDKAGVIKKILIDDGSPVEYDQSLFVIE